MLDDIKNLMAKQQIICKINCHALTDLIILILYKL